MDQAAIAKLTERYRRLPPENLANLDEERHRLSAEEATALDAVMTADETRQPIAQAIGKLDAKKQRNFRVGIIVILLCATVFLPLVTWVGEMPVGYQAIGFALVIGAALAVDLFLQWVAGRHASPERIQPEVSGDAREIN
ncbi:MAG: hypothetical protein ABWY00_11980 [Dongiaceae bacterium]